MIKRSVFKVEVREKRVTEVEIYALKDNIAKHFSITFDDATYLMSVNTIQKDMYDINDDKIAILYKDGTLKDISEASEILNVELLSKKISKYYLCYQRF